MVAAAIAYPAERGRRWLVYLALSVCANAFLLSLVHVNTQQEAVFKVPILQVNLMSLARPAPPPPPAVRQVETRPPSPPMPAVYHPVVTAVFAPEKIAAVPKLSPPPAEPVVSTPEKDVPLPKIRPKEPLPTPVKAEPVPVIKESKPVQLAKMPKPPVEKPQPAPKVEVRPEVAPAPSPARNQNAGKDETTVIHEARYRHQIPPSYPRRALEMGQQGAVTLHAEVMPNGAPRELKIAHSSGFRLLDMAALEAVRKWKFVPTSVNGKAVVSWVRVPVNFVIQ